MLWLLPTALAVDAIRRRVPGLGLGPARLLLLLAILLVVLVIIVVSRNRR